MSYTQYFENAVTAGRQMAAITGETINKVLTEVAEAAVAATQMLIEENGKDLDRMATTDPKYDRLKLTPDRVKSIAGDIINVSRLASPLGKLLADKQLENGLRLSKITVPLGVVGVIYEARPNVTFDVFALCFKTGNVAVLKGGSDAHYSNLAIISIIHKILQQNHIDTHAATLLPHEREATSALLNATGYVDVLIPRGSQGLINYVRDNSKVPVIETGAGIVHTYIDESADIKKAADIVFNSKTRRVSVCNALDCLLIHASLLKHLPEIAQKLAIKGVIIYADHDAYKVLDGHYPTDLLQHAQPEHFGTEFLDYKMSVKVVDGLNAAINHIAKYSSKHSEAIVTEDDGNADIFLRDVDAAAVYLNASTAFTDGAQFGLGAEIGISTQKLHARGPMALDELTSYKWLIKGNGQIRTP